MKVGIIGCGAIARAHLDSLKRLAVEVVGVCDVDEERAARAAARFGVPRTYGQPAELLERERPDVVHVLTPPQSHKDVSIKAMNAGCHVLVEKPMAVDLREADEMVEASSRSLRVLGVCHTHLFNPAVLEARALATTGRLGTVVGVETAFVFRGKLRDRFLNTGWIQDLPGGAVHELAPHSVYLHREFLGKLSVASAVRKPIAGLAPDSMEFRALFEGESGLGILAISLSGSPQQSALRIYGTEMTVHIDLRGHTAVKARRDSGDSHLEKALPNLELGAQLAARTFAAMLAGQRLPVHREHAGLIRGFYGALRDGRPPPVTADDGRAVVAVLDRLWATLP